MKSRARTDDSIDVEVFNRLCEEVNTSFGLGLYLCLKYGDIISLLEARLEPEHFIDHICFAKNLLLQKFLSKWKGHTDSRLKPQQAALEAWNASELKCAETNHRFRNDTLLNSSVQQYLYIAARKISDILGPVPSFEDFDSKCSWSNGATYDHRMGTPVTHKLSKLLTVTRDAARLLGAVVGHDPGWYKSYTGSDLDGPCNLLMTSFQIVPGNRFATVPKTSKTDRSISIEPTGNIFLQKALGKMIRQRLKRVGVDLDDQTKNQQLASFAHKLGLATVDLSSASDTVSKMLVLHLLPYDWYMLLDSVRSKTTVNRASNVHLEKFSSMGNGFTFELESLIFFALSSAVCEVDGYCSWYTSVYGDDIIIPSGCYDTLCAVLEECGFVVNKDKSFSSGPYFESCGAHYFNGYLVTPVYCKERSLQRQHYIVLHNKLVRWEKRIGVNIRTKSSIRYYYRKRFKDRYEPRIPFSSDDRGFIVDSDSLGTIDRNHGYRCVCYSLVSRNIEVDNLDFYHIKHRFFHLTSSDPKGHCKLGMKSTFYRYTTSYIHEEIR